MSMTPEHPENLASLIIEQFMLHEVQHHELEAGTTDGPAPRLPLAHSLVDIYKCLHQGEFGVGHTIDHPEGFRQRLLQEITTCPDHARGPAVECVSVDGDMLRVHLHALRRLSANDVQQAVDALTNLCVESALITQGGENAFFETLDRFRALNRAGDIILAGHVFMFPGEWVDTFLSDVHTLSARMGQVPVFSHSEAYRRLNRPSYRVVQRSVLKASPLACLLEA